MFLKSLVALASSPLRYDARSRCSSRAAGKKSCYMMSADPPISLEDVSHD
jgi:hypothetical protein